MFAHNAKRKDRPDVETGSNIATDLDGVYQGLWYKFAEAPYCRKVVDESATVIERVNALAASDPETGTALALEELRKHCPGVAEDASWIFPIQTIDYLDRFEIGSKSFCNIGLLHLSAGRLTIGKNCFIGPNAHFYTPNHYVDDVELRRAGWQYDADIRLGDDVWFGGDVTVTPGVTIGNNVVVGANAVVTKDVPDNVVIGGNPARIIKRLKG